MKRFRTSSNWASFPIGRPNAAGLLCLFAMCMALTYCGGVDRTEDGDSVVRVAVAGNFAAPQAELVDRFRATTGVNVETSLGATGQLYAQIKNGAPFDVFLAADTARPRLLEEEGLTVPGTRFTYAIGRLVFYAPTWDSVPSGEQAMRLRLIENLAITNPATAPYGAAAREVLDRWESNGNLGIRIVRGENVAQTYQFVESGAADAGFVALSQVINKERRQFWIVPENQHHPIRQDAVLLLHGESNRGASQFLRFLQSEEATSVLREFGYTLPNGGS